MLPQLLSEGKTVNAQRDVKIPSPIINKDIFLYIKILVSEQGNVACEKLSNCHNLLIMRNDKKDYRNSQHFAFAF